MSRSSPPLTSRDIARLADVSQTTVSRVLRTPEQVQPDTRQRVLEVIARSGYQPSATARSMRTRRSHSVALVVANLALNPLYPALLQELFGALRARGLNASVWEAEAFTDDTVSALSESAVDGVIVTTAVDAAIPFLERLAQRKPVVLVNRTVQSHAFDQVGSDNEAGGAAIATYFLKGGRSRPALLSAHSEASTIRDREKGYRQVLSDAGIPLHPDHVASVEDVSYDAGFNAVQQLLSQCQPDSIFCVNDIIAIGALDGIRAYGGGTSPSVWVVGYDDVPMCSWKAVQLTTVRQPLRQMAALSVARLVAQLEAADHHPQHVLLPNELVKRASSG